MFPICSAIYTTCPLKIDHTLLDSLLPSRNNIRMTETEQFDLEEARAAIRQGRIGITNAEQLIETGDELLADLRQCLRILSAAEKHERVTTVSQTDTAPDFPEHPQS